MLSQYRRQIFVGLAVVCSLNFACDAALSQGGVIEADSWIGPEDQRPYHGKEHSNPAMLRSFDIGAPAERAQLKSENSALMLDPKGNPIGSPVISVPRETLLKTEERKIQAPESTKPEPVNVMVPRQDDLFRVPERKIEAPIEKAIVLPTQQPTFKSNGNEIGSGSKLPNYETWLKEINSGSTGISVPVSGSEDTSTGESQISPSKMLQGWAEHRVRLNAVPSKYRAGSAINIQELQSLTPNNFWRKVSNQQAGTWVSEENAIFSTKEFKDVVKNGVTIHKAGREVNKFTTELAYKRIIIGFQKDAEGNIWTYDGGLTEVIQGMGYPIIDSDFQREIIEEKKDRTIIKNTSTRFVTNGGIISETTQLEQIDLSFQITPNLRRVECSLKLFDENGDPLAQTEGARLWHKTAPFHVVDDYQGHDMHALFIEYLRAHNLGYLIPQ